MAVTKPETSTDNVATWTLQTPYFLSKATSTHWTVCAVDNVIIYSKTEEYVGYPNSQGGTHPPQGTCKQWSVSFDLHHVYVSEDLLAVVCHLKSQM